MVSAKTQLPQHFSLRCGDRDTEQVQVDGLVGLGIAARRKHVLPLDAVIANAQLAGVHVFDSSWMPFHWKNLLAANSDN